MLERRNRGNLRSRYLSVVATRDAIILTFEPDFALTLGLATRAREARRRVKACLRAFGIHANGAGGVTACMAGIDTGHARRVVAEVDKVLDGFARGGLTPRMVEQVLGITARERLRWTKDGRLPQSGSGSFRRGPNVIHFPLHPAHKIASLAVDPSIVAAWREADRENADIHRVSVL
jgi:hypothetical protein